MGRNMPALTADYGRGYTVKGLWRMVQFAKAFPDRPIDRLGNVGTTGFDERAEVAQKPGGVRRSLRREEGIHLCALLAHSDSLAASLPFLDKPAVAANREQTATGVERHGIPPTVARLRTFILL
jgi:hypothetical protein